MKISIIGAGTMGAGIAQVAAKNGHEVCLFDSFDDGVFISIVILIFLFNLLISTKPLVSIVIM